nr:PREDICTED: dirigent protein 22-like [Daucus carota subsp. sativus]
MNRPSLYLIMMYVVVVSAAVLAFSCNAADQQPEDVKKWLEQRENHKKITKLHFYFHELRERTSTLVAQANSSATSPTFFGVTYVMDDPLTAGPEFTSEPVGRAQGLYASASKEEAGLVCVFNFVFTNDKYNGSSLSIFGYNPTLRQSRELVVVGGTGVFRMARGVAVLSFVYFDVAGGNATGEYNVIVEHY